MNKKETLELRKDMNSLVVCYSPSLVESFRDFLSFFFRSFYLSSFFLLSFRHKPVSESSLCLSSSRFTVDLFLRLSSLSLGGRSREKLIGLGGRSLCSYEIFLSASLKERERATLRKPTRSSSSPLLVDSPSLLSSFLLACCAMWKPRMEKLLLPPPVILGPVYSQVLSICESVHIVVSSSRSLLFSIRTAESIFFFFISRDASLAQ